MSSKAPDFDRQLIDFGLEDAVTAPACVAAACLWRQGRV